MKVRVALHINPFQVVVGILAVSWVSGQAPYPPSGYRPSGRQFALPSKPNQNQGVGGAYQPQNQYGPPQNPPPNQYEAPARRPQITETPPNQYLPSLEPTDVRNFAGQQDFLGGQQGNGHRQTYLGPQNQGGFVQNGQADQQQYYSEQGQQNVNRQQQQNDFVSNEQQLNNQQHNLGQEQQVNRPQQGYSGQGQQQTYQNGNQQGWAQQAFGENTNVAREQASVSRQNSGISSLNRNYLSPQQTQRNLKNNQQDQNFGQRQAARQLYQTNAQEDEDVNIANSDDEDLTNTDDRDQNVAQNYLPPTTTEGYLVKPTQRRRYPEPTTRRPGTQEPIEPENDEQEDPNVAIATAVARGQYYLLQADGRLQRVVYKTTQTQEDVKNNGYSANLIYRDVQPITAPIYSYSAPLIRLN